MYSNQPYFNSNARNTDYFNVVEYFGLVNLSMTFWIFVYHKCLDQSRLTHQEARVHFRNLFSLIKFSRVGYLPLNGLTAKLVNQLQARVCLEILFQLMRDFFLFSRLWCLHLNGLIHMHAQTFLQKRVASDSP